MTDPLLNSIAQHIGFLGYSTPPLPEPIPGVEVINATHPNRPPFWVFPLSGGAYFRVVYRLSDAVQPDLLNFLKFVNELNTTAVLGHFISSEGFLFFGAWYFGQYDAGRLGIFIDRFLFETTIPHKEFSQKSQQYLS